MKYQIIRWIRNWYVNNSGNAKGIVIGVSGGKDSTVCAALCAEAIGADKVFGVIMPNGVQNDLDDAVRVCNTIGIDYEIINIKNIYSAFITSKRVYEEETLINVCPRIRMSILYMIAQENSYRVCGTGNLSERTIGYFTKWGDGACDFNPIGNLTKTQVVELGHELGLPSYLVDKVPSDGLCGKNDEDRLGFTYEQLDNFIEGNRDNIPVTIYNTIEKKYKISKHKLENIPMFNFEDAEDGI